MLDPRDLPPAMVTDDDLAQYVGTDAADPFVGSCLETAKEMVSGLLAAELLPSIDPEQSIPDKILARAVLEVGSELYHRRNAPNGVAQFATTDAAPIRVARDPMVAARPILAPYLAGGFA